MHVISPPRAPTLSTKQTGRPFKHFYRRLLPHKFPQNPVRHRRLRAPAGACNTAGGVELHPSRLPYHMRPNLRPPDQTTAHREAAPQEKMADHPIPNDVNCVIIAFSDMPQYRLLRIHQLRTNCLPNVKSLKTVSCCPMYQNTAVHMLNEKSGISFRHFSVS